MSCPVSTHRRRAAAWLCALLCVLPATFGANAPHSAAAGPGAVKAWITGDAPDAATWGLGGVRDSERPASLERVSVSQGASIHVETRAGLIDALSTAQGGETILVAGGDYGSLRIGNDFAATVTIAAADADAPPVFSGLTLRGASNVAFEGVTFDYTYTAGAGEWKTLVHVRNSEGIRFTDATFLGDDQVGGADPVLEGYPTGRALMVDDSRGVVVEGSTLSGFWKGIGLKETVDTIIRDNEITQMRVDGVAMTHVQNLLIKGNHIHDFRRYGGTKSDGDTDHADMIQLYGQADRLGIVSRDIVIHDNLLDIGGSEGRSQSIFMPNKAVDRGRKDMDFAYANIAITENVIVNDHIHGIKVGTTQRLVVANNTLLRSDPAQTAGDPGEGSGAPQIWIAQRSTEVAVAANAAARIHGPEGQADWAVAGNVAVHRDARDGPLTYETTFLGGGDVAGAPENLIVLLGTDLHAAGAGATRLLYDPAPDAVRALAQGAGEGLDQAFDAGLSAGPGGPAAASGARFAWDFGDGTVAEGVRATHSYDTGGTYTVTLRVTLPDGTTDTFTLQRVATGPDLVAFDPAAGGFVAGAAGTSAPLDADLPPGVLRDGALALGHGAMVLGADLLPDLPGTVFGRLSLGFEPAPGGAPGEIVKIPGMLMVEILPGGGLRVSAVDGGLNRAVEISGAGLSPGAPHDLVLAYDAAAGGMTIAIDGAVAGTLALGTAPVAPLGAELRLGGAGTDGAEGRLTAFDLDAAAPPPPG